MKIINIILTSQNGGAEQAFLDYTAALLKLGHEVIAIMKDDAPYANLVEKLGVKVSKIGNNLGYHDFIAVAKIVKIIKETDADLVVSHMSRSTVLTKKAIKKIKNKKVFQIAVNHSDNVKRSLGADIICGVNKNIFFKAVDLGQAEDRCFVIPNAIDLSDIIKPNLEVNLSQKDEIIIGAIGRLDRTKGFDYLIKSLQVLEKISFEENLNKKFTLKIAGSGYFEPELRALVKELNLEDKVEFLGWISDKKEFFSKIDIFCLPSLNEPFGIVLLESMKFAKPIVSTDADGPKEILKNEVDALIVNLKPIEKLEEIMARSFLKVIKDPILLNNLVKNASLKLQEKYSYKALEERLGDIVGKVCK
ncbi:MAG: glycosyltransferase [Pelagibacterales bacterium]|nr:glycosyltransferase [Pelagibacterales bacterium]